MIAVCMSTYREGLPALSAVRSAQVAGDFVIVGEGAVEGAPAAGDETPLEVIRVMGAVVCPKPRTYRDDAAKRTALLALAKAEANRRGRADGEPLWVVWLDGDELLLWPELLRDVAYRASFSTGAGGFPIRIVELDGSVALSYGKVIAADAVTRYLQSSYQVELVNGMVVALPNVKVCAAGGVPAVPDELMAELATRQDEILAVHRPPLAGEPHILHRSALRSPERAIERQHEAESRWFSEILGPDGSVLKEVPR